MKIKKKKYEKDLEDAFWRGVDAGIRFAKARPDMAESFSVEQIREMADKIQKAFGNLGEGIRKAFKRGGLI